MAFRSKFTGEQIDALLDLIEPETTYKFYDCFFGDWNNDHDEWPFIATKYVDLNTGDVYIAPDSWNGISCPEGSNYIRAAVMHVPDVRYYGDNKWLSPEEVLSNDDVCSFDFNAHPEITEEEFYHIPEEVVIPYNDRNKLEEVFEHLYSILNRYGIEPSGDSAYNTTNINFPIPVCGYKNLSIEISPGNYAQNDNIIDSYWTRNDSFGDVWDYNKPIVENVEAVFISIGYTGFGLCRLTHSDGTKEYRVSQVVG